MDQHHEHAHCCGSQSIFTELVAHIPYAIFSVAFALILLSFTSFSFITQNNPEGACRGANVLFHSFHFMHLVFAATGTIITFCRFSRNLLLALVIGILCPAIFCMLSDVILPYLGGRLLGVEMSFHICFISELSRVLPFLGVGILNGIILSLHKSAMQPMYSVFSHTLHTLVSSLASTYYLVSHGLVNWHHHIGFVFIFLIIAVVVPCSMSDVVVPMLFARSHIHEHKKH